MPNGSDSESSLALYWIIPRVLAGMPMPFVHPERRARFGGPLDAFQDDLPLLQAVGICAVVCLLNIPGDAAVYTSAGFTFHLMPIPDGGAPTIEQFGDFMLFAERQRASARAMVAHCEAGLGRTGTVLAGYLIFKEGHTTASAIAKVRAACPGAIETGAQLKFLHELSQAT